MANRFQIILGNKNYSSWSLRPWLILKALPIAFDETVIPLYQADTKALIQKYSHAGKVPILIDAGTVIWDSLAIAEYLAESFPEAKLWPQDQVARAHARSISAEMHSGFTALRSELPMNVRRKPNPVPMSEAAEKDIRRIQEIWSECRRSYADLGPFLFGAFSIADALYAPVVFRFDRYAVHGAPEDLAYRKTILELPWIQEWIEQSAREPWTIDASEK